MELIDISVIINENLPVYAGDPGIKLISKMNHEKDNLEVTHLDLGAHTGTHIDFPFHFIENGKKSDEFKIEKFYGSAIVVDFTQINLGEGINVDDLIEKGINQDLSVEFILLKTQNSRIYSKKFRTDYVYLYPEAAQYLAGLNIKGVGIDYLSIEKYCSINPLTHIALLENDILIIEGLLLDHVCEGKYQLIAFPISFEGIEGAPVRAVLANFQLNIQ